MTQVRLTHAPNGAPIIGIVGWKNSGKTTLTVKLIEEIVRRGYRVASLKHAHHNLRIDDKDTDSARHRRAGASQVAVVSEKRWAIVTELGDAPEPSFVEILARLGSADLVIVEGYKREAIAKIEARRNGSSCDEPIYHSDANVVAIAADHAIEDAGERIVFQLDDVPAIANFIVARFLNRSEDA